MDRAHHRRRRHPTHRHSRPHGIGRSRHPGPRILRVVDRGRRDRRRPTQNSHRHHRLEPKATVNRERPRPPPRPTNWRSACTSTPVSATLSPPAPATPAGQHLAHLRHGTPCRGSDRRPRGSTRTPESPPVLERSGSWPPWSSNTPDSGARPLHLQSLPGLAEVVERNCIRLTRGEQRSHVSRDSDPPMCLQKVVQDGVSSGRAPARGQVEQSCQRSRFRGLEPGRAAAAL